MKASLVSAADQLVADELVSENIVLEKPALEKAMSGARGPRPEAASMFDLEVYISRTADGQTRGRAANLAVADIRAATVRETLQLLIDAARKVINESITRGAAIPRITPPNQPDDAESRFIVPLVM